MIAWKPNWPNNFSLWLRINTAKVVQGLGPYGRTVSSTASSTASCISCSKKTGWQTNHLSLQAWRLTNEEITAFSGHKQGKFLRYYHSRWYSIKVFIAHILVLLWLNSSFNWNATANLTNRENFREKFRRKIRVERIFARKVGPNYWWTRTTARNFPLTRTMGSGKIHWIFFELSRWARLRHFSSKSPEIHEFRRITLSLLLHNTVPVPVQFSTNWAYITAMIVLMCILHCLVSTGILRTDNALSWLDAQLVERCTGIVEGMGSNPVKALIFFRV